MLTILPPKFIDENSTEKLSYRIIMEDWTFFIDALDGEVLNAYSNFIE